MIFEIDNPIGKGCIDGDLENLAHMWHNLVQNGIGSWLYLVSLVTSLDFLGEVPL